MTAVVKPLTVHCPYCRRNAQLVSGTTIYPHRPDLAEKRFWRCGSCDAYVGCHEGTTKPLGRLANAELRAWKQRAHAAFDPIWQDGNMRRERAYGWLARQLGISRPTCHIGMFDVEMCQKVVEVCKEMPQ